MRQRERDLLLDDLLGYRFVLLIRPECTTLPLREWAAAHAVAVVRPGVEFEEHDSVLLRFMRRRDLDFALVRPDRQIFGAGLVDALPRVQAAFDAQFARTPPGSSELTVARAQ